jgi:hypothetical protein
VCEATTIIAIAGLVLGVAGGVQQANAQKAAGQAQEEQSKENAKAANAQARNTELSAQVDEDRRRQMTRQQLATQRSVMAANNLDMSTGSALDILGDTAAIGEQDALTIRANAAREAWGLRSQATDYLNQGRVARVSGNNAAKGTYLTTAANAAQQGGNIYASRKGSAPSNTTNSRASKTMMNTKGS